MPTLLRLRLLLGQDVTLYPNNAPGQGWFLALLRQIDPLWANALHESGTRHPYSVSPLYAPAACPLDTEDDYGASVLRPAWTENQRPELSLLSGQTIALRIGFADDEEARRVCRALASSPVPPLGGAPCRLLHIPRWQDGDPDCLFATWAMLADAPPARTLLLRFQTPTAFTHHQGEIALLPEPIKLWESWQRAWQFAPAWPTGAETVSIEGLRVARYDLRTEAVPLKGGTARGFVGTLELEWKRDVPPEVRRAACALAGIADFLGTGRKTMMGMGQTQFRVLD